MIRQRFIRAAVIAVTLGCVSLGGCASLTGGASSTDTVETIKALSAHMGQCDRHYQGGVGLGASFTFNVDCKATAVVQPPAPSEPIG